MLNSYFTAERCRYVHRRFTYSFQILKGDEQRLHAGASGSVGEKERNTYCGNGDFTHPAWREELEEKLEPAEDGLYVLKDEYRIKDEETPGGSGPAVCYNRGDQFHL